MIHCTECHKPMPELPKHLEKPGITFRCRSCISREAEVEQDRIAKRRARKRTPR